MAETETPAKGSGSPADNLSAWVDKKDAEIASRTVAVESEPEKPATPAEPTVAPVAVPTQPSWKDVVIGDDVDHGFFKGKAVPQVIESYKHAERAKQEAERRAAELQKELDALRKPDAPKTIEPNLWFENAEEAQKRIDERVARVAEEKIQAFIQKTQAEQQTARAFETGGKAYDAAREALNLDAQTWNLRAPAVMLHLTDPNSPFYGDGNGLFDHNQYVKVAKALWPEAAPVAVKPVVEPPPPPGAKRPAPASVNTSSASPLKREQADAYREISSIAGLNPDNMLARARKRGENRG